MARGPSSHRAKPQNHAIRLHSEAELDLAEVFTWYEEQSPGLGGDFLDEAGELLKRIARFPYACHLIEPPFRRALFARYPYAIYYLVERRQALILAILHQRREPDTWKARFGI